VEEATFVVTNVSQHVRLDFVLVLLVEVAVVCATGKASASFDDLSLAEKIGVLRGPDLVGCLKNHPIAEIKRQNSRCVRSKGPG
jgi:hypothetical protein